MQTKPCEVCMTYGDGEQHDCGQPARLNVNGFPMCARHFHDFEDEEQIESLALFEPQPCPGVDLGAGDRSVEAYQGAPRCTMLGCLKKPGHGGECDDGY